MTNKEKLQQIAEMKDPSLRMHRLLTERAMAEAVAKMDIAKGEKGDDGYTPIKGKDYYTPEEIAAVINYIQSKVKDGDVGPMGPQGVQGRPGMTPLRGVDYWTKEDQAKVIEDTLKRIKIPTPKDGKDANVDDVVKKATDELGKTFNIKKILNDPQLRMLLHGGGGTSGTSSPLTTKGDVYTYSTTNDRLPVGNNGEVLTADSTQPTGLKWSVNGSGTVTSVATGAGLTGGAITTTGTVALNSKLSPLDTLTGNSLSFPRVNAGETALEYVAVNTFSSVPVSGQTTVTANATATALTFVAGSNITITTDNTAKSVTINSTASGGITFTEVTGTSQSALVNKGYITNNAGLVTVTLPASAVVGDIVQVSGSGAGGWKLAQNASQSIVWTAGGVAGTNVTTTGVGGYLASVDRYDSVTVICIGTDNTWKVDASKGNITIV